MLKVDAGPSAGQYLLKQGSDRFIKEACSLPEVRVLIDHPTGVPAGYLEQAGELGWFAMLVPEDEGGGSVSGEGVADAALIGELRGGGLQPGPFVPTNVVAARIAASGSSDQRGRALASLVNGTATACWAVADASGDWAPGRAIQAMAAGDGFLLTGVAGLVQDADLAQWMLVTASTSFGLTQFLIPAGTPGVSVVALESLDLTKRFFEVHCHDAAVGPDTVVGGVDQAEGDVERQLQLALVLQIAETVGAMSSLFEMTRQYSIDRVAFGRPIGSFQAIKHLLADTSLDLEICKAGLTDAVQAVQNERDDAAEVVSMVKAFTAEAAIDLGQSCLQVHGGIGFTWEHDLHLYIRRLTSDAVLYGDAIWHRERICRVHEFEERP
jgi:alkylation response protein AidB-like acyl-CoA dehydrogenase